MVWMVEEQEDEIFSKKTIECKRCGMLFPDDGICPYCARTRQITTN